MAIKYYVSDRSVGDAADGKPTNVLSGHLHGEKDTGLLFLYNGSGWQASGQYAFKTLSVSGQSDVVADAFDDTLTLEGGSNVNITTDAGTDTITISAIDTTYSAGDGLDLSGTVFSAHLSADPAASSLVLEDATSGNPVVTLPAATTSVAGVLTASDKSKLDGIESGAEVNQNAFGTVVVPGQSNVVADQVSDILNLSEGANVTITTDNATDTVTIASSDTTYTAGDGLTLSGTEFSAHLTADPAATTVVLEDSTSTNTVVTLPAATTSLAGVLTASDKSKLDGIAPGADVNQNAISTINVVGGGSFSASIPTDTVNFDATGAASVSVTGDTVTFDATNTTYTAGDGLTLSGTEFSAHLSADPSATDLVLEDSTSAVAVVTLPSATTSNAGVMSAADKQFLDSLDSAVTLQGTWDASTGSFPGGGTAQAGYSYIVSIGGTVDGVEFVANDRVVAITDNASTTTYANNWHKLDYTDQVLSVNSQTGAVSLGIADLTDVDGTTGDDSTVVTGAAGTANNLSMWDGSGDVIDAGVTVIDTGAGWSSNDTSVPTAALIDTRIASSAAGSDGQIQYNNAGSFGAEANFAWNDIDKMLQVQGSMRLKEGGTIPSGSPANDEAVYYVETEVISTVDTVARVMLRRGDGQDLIVSSYIF